MGTTNYGEQTLSFDFKAPGKSEIFNKLNYKIIEDGIYEGGTLSYNDTTHVDLSPMTVYISDSSTEIGVRIETSLSVTVEVAAGNPYVIARFAWNNTENNYMDILAVDFGSIQSKDLIIGRCMFPGGILDSSFDYSRRTIPSKLETVNKQQEFKVIPTEPYSDQVYVYAGTFSSSEKTIEFSGGNSPSFSGVNPNTIADERIDLLYIDEDGILQIEEGVDQASPEPPVYRSKFVVAEVHLYNSKTYIDGNDITIIESSFVLNSTTDSTSKDTGALVVEGGVGIEKNLYVGGDLNVTGKINFPVGTIMMFDANNAGGTSGGSSGAWTDNVTMPGWYACIAENDIHGCPDLTDKFVMGKVVAGSGVSGGSNTMLDHTHSVSTEDLSHTHTAYRTTSFTLSYTDSSLEAGTYTIPAVGNSSNVAQDIDSQDSLYFTGGSYSTGGMSANSTHSHTVGSGNSPTSTDNRPAYYSVIYIRKCL